MDQSRLESAFAQSARPDLALVANHGYAGVDVSVGGAPDTAGQHIYVNDLALALDRLGYRVTIFSRGGFPHYGSDRLRDLPEYLSAHVRYVFVPGGGDRFLPQQEMALALDEQLEWLDDFIRAEAEARGQAPWQVYQLFNSHDWDGAVLGTRLIERWRDDLSAETIVRLLDGVADDEVLEDLQAERHTLALGEAPVHHLGRLLLDCECSPATPLEQRVQAVAARWVARRKCRAGCVDLIGDTVAKALHRARRTMAPALHALVAYEALGVAVLTLVPDEAEALKARLERVDTHVWTPHSLAELDEEEFLQATRPERRHRRFCERRDHERMIAERTQVFAATSTEIAERLVTHYRVPAEQIYYFPPCVDQLRFRRYRTTELDATYAYLAELSGIDPATLRQAKIIFETSRMDRHKRKDLLLSAFAQVAPYLPETLLFIGGGPENQVFVDLRRQLRDTPALADRAFLAGFIPEEHLGPLLSLSAVYCSASEKEGFGMSVSQAAACQTAVVASDLTPFVVQYAPGDAVIVPAGDDEDFASALRRLLADDDERDWRAAGLAEKVRVLDWQTQTGHFLDYLRRHGLKIADGQPDCA